MKEIIERKIQELESIHNELLSIEMESDIPELLIGGARLHITKAIRILNSKLYENTNGS